MPIQGLAATSLANPSSTALNQLGLAIDVKRDYNASGSSASTTGTISLTTPTILTLAGALADAANGQGISIAGAGASGALLVTTIVSGAGTTSLTLATAASTAVTGAAVNHDDTVAILAWLAAIEAASSSGTRPARGIAPSGAYMVSSTINFGAAFGANNYSNIVIDADAAQFIATPGTSMGGVVSLLTADNGQFIGCTFLFGEINGNGQTLNGMEIRYVNDSYVRVRRAASCAGNSGVVVNQGASPTAGTFNNIIIIQDLTFNAFGFASLTDSTSGALGFQGNQVFFGQVIANTSNGIYIDATGGNASFYNTFFVGVAEHQANGYGIVDNAGHNTWYVTVTDANAIAGFYLPSTASGNPYIVGRFLDGTVIDAPARIFDAHAGVQTYLGGSAPLVLQTTQSGAAANSPSLFLNGWSGTAATGARFQAASGGGWYTANAANSAVTFQIDDSGNVTIHGKPVFAGPTATTATAGTAALPTAPVGFVEVTIGGTVYKVPYYAS